MTLPYRDLSGKRKACLFSTPADRPIVASLVGLGAQRKRPRRSGAGSCELTCQLACWDT